MITRKFLSVVMSGKSFSINTNLRRAEKHLKKGEFIQVRQCYQDVLDRFPQNQAAIAGLAEIGRRAPRAVDSSLGQQQYIPLLNCILLDR